MINLSSIGTNGRGIVVSGNVMRTVQSSQNAIFVAGTSNGLIKNNVLVGYTMSIGVTGPSPGCSAAVMGNVTSDSPVINSGCAQNTVVTGNSDNRPGVLGSSSLIGKAGVLVRAHRTGTQSFTAGTGSGSGAYVVFNTEDVDNGRNYSEGIGVFTAPVAGYYHAHACVRFNAAGFGATESANLSFEIPGASITPSLNRTTSGGSADTFTSCVDDVIQLASGAGLQVFVSSNGSGTRSLSGTGVYSTYLYVTQVSD